MKQSIAALLILLILPSIVIASQVGQITAARGMVQFRADNKTPYYSLKKGAFISEGYWIKTGADGWVEMTLDDKSKFTLANSTEMEVTSFLLTKKERRGSFNLAQGKMRASVVKLTGRQSGMTIKSATAVAGIKGTEFLMMTQGPANIFFGNEGTVDVSGDVDGPQRPLTASTMTQNTRGITPLEPLQIEAGSPVAEARDILDRITAAVPPTEWTDSGRIPDIIARWNINYGHYLADSGKYNDALHVFQIALDLSTVAEIRADSLLERGSVYARFLRKPELALAEYLQVVNEYPKLRQAETALFSAAMSLMELGITDQARIRFNQYLNDYPSGRYRSTVETLLLNLR